MGKRSIIVCELVSYNGISVVGVKNLDYNLRAMQGLEGFNTEE